MIKIPGQHLIQHTFVPPPASTFAVEQNACLPILLRGGQLKQKRMSPSLDMEQGRVGLLAIALSNPTEALLPE